MKAILHIGFFDNFKGQDTVPTDPGVNIQNVAFSPNEKRIIGGGWSMESGGEVVVWDVTSGRRIAWLRPNDAVFAVALAQNPQLAACGTSEGAIQLWNLTTKKRIASLEGHESAVQALAFASDGRSLASASYDGTLRIWDLERIKPLPQLRGHPDSIVDWEIMVSGVACLSNVSHSCRPADIVTTGEQV
jgi:WD40 repeat protein